MKTCIICEFFHETGSTSKNKGECVASGHAVRAYVTNWCNKFKESGARTGVFVHIRRNYEIALAAEIRAFKKRRKLTYAKIGAVCAVHGITVQRWAAGTRSPRKPHLQKLDNFSSESDK